MTGLLFETKNHVKEMIDYHHAINPINPENPDEILKKMHEFNKRYMMANYPELFERKTKCLV